MPKIIIIGGGIGGLAAAACLRARTIDTDIYERAPELREVGAALALWPNATRVLKRLGILDGLLERSHIAPAGALRGKNGVILKQMTTITTEVPALFTHRADAHNALLSLIPRESIHLGKVFTGLERDGARIRALFADGTDSGWVDALIGADGLRSRVRATTLRDGPPPYRGYVAWRGVVDFDSGDQIVGETWGRGQRFGFIPLGAGRVAWWATANIAERLIRKLCAAEKNTWKADLLKRFAGWHAPIEKLLAATPESALLCNEIRDRRPPKTQKPWGTGAVTLLGDAAHPTTPNLGQGACMAIEDAAVLAQAVAAIPQIEIAFRVYELTRHARTSLIVRESHKFGRIGQWNGRIACSLRNTAMRLAPDAVLRKQFRNLWTFDAWDTPLKMPPQ